MQVDQPVNPSEGRYRPERVKSSSVSKDLLAIIRISYTLLAQKVK